ncbi:MAG: metallophosphoesterase [Bacteroidales bacterium]|nr:metallophosphoesterase [Bacteroidales bacterium]
MRKTAFQIVLAALLAVSCNKVSPIGVLVAGTAVEDRVAMSNLFYRNHYEDKVWLLAKGDYTFLVGADSHITDDSARMDEMLSIGLEDDDLFYAHLGDIADTKAEYYVTLDSLLQEAKSRYVNKHYHKVGTEYVSNDNTDPDPVTMPFDRITYPFFPVVGNHDITRNGWALWSNIFHSSFYEIDVLVDLGDGNYAFDHLIFLDSASGTLGKTQIDLINQGVLDGKHADDTYPYRNTFVFSHTNIFRPQFFEFASTFTREETFFLLDQFEKWNVSAVFCGHTHTWDERNYNGVHHFTLDTMCERNNPEPGDYLVRMFCNADGTLEWSPVHMSTTKRK